MCTCECALSVSLSPFLFLRFSFSVSLSPFLFLRFSFSLFLGVDTDDISATEMITLAGYMVVVVKVAICSMRRCGRFVDFCCVVPLSAYSEIS
jgi:hypothetical protein